MGHLASQQRPLVSVILATYNEAVCVRPCMASLLAQDTSDFDLEILAVDALSNDGTREFLDQAAAADPRVKVLVNEKKRAPFAFNLGLREARGEFVCMFGSHTVYQKDYISVCLKEMKAHGAVLCGGRVITQPAADTLQARLVAMALGHPFGSSRKSFRTQPEGFSDTINYPVLRRDVFLEMGGCAEDLLRNQDNDIDQKLCAKGYKLFHTWKTRCFYHPKGAIRDLFAYAYRNGFWNVLSLQRNAASMSIRHFVPFIFVLGLLAFALVAAAGVFLPIPHRSLAIAPLASLLTLHLSLGSLAAVQVAVHQKDRGALWLPLIFLGFHLSYGFGTLWALLTRAKPPNPLPQSLVTAN